MKRKKWIIPLLFTVGTVLVLWFAAAQPLNTKILPQRSGPSRQWSEGWVVLSSTNEISKVQLPVRLNDDQAVLENMLPLNMPQGFWLYLKTNYQQVTATVNGMPVVVEGIHSHQNSSLRGDLPWTRIHLLPHMSGGNLRLRFSDTGSKPFVEVYAARLGTPDEISFLLLTDTLPILLYSMLMILFTLLLFAFATLEATRHKKGLRRGYLFLLLFVMQASGWFFTDSDVTGILFLGNEAFYLITLANFLLLPLPFLAYTASLQPDTRRITGALGLLMGANFLYAAVLTVIGQLTLWSTLMLTHMLLGLMLGVMLWLNFSPRRRQWLDADWQQGTIISSIAMFINLVVFYALPFEDNCLSVRMGLVVLVVTLGYRVLRANAEMLAQARSVERLRIQEEEYRIAVRQSDKHVVRFDVTTGTLLCADADPELFGPHTEIPGLPECALRLGMIEPESVRDFQTLFDDLHAGKANGTCAVCLRTTTARRVWYRADFTMIFSKDNQPLQAVISYYDITQQHEKELAYEKWKQSYAEIPSESMNNYEYNLSRNALVSETGAMLAPLPPDVRSPLSRVIAYLADEHVAPMDDQAFRAFFDRERLLDAFTRGIKSDRLEFRRLDGHGNDLWTQANVQLISDPYSGNVQCSLLLQDVDDVKRAELMVRERSVSDPLTGLLNRNAFEESLNALIAQQEPGVVHALLMIDVDGFKRVNDTFGHQFGDRVLVDIADTLRGMMRGDDLIGRIGGDEYMVCLRNVRENSGFLEKRSSFLCRSLNRQYGGDIAITGSIGLALYPRDGASFEELYHHADQALYYAKHHGKNRYVFYHDHLYQGAETPLLSAESLPDKAAATSDAPPAPAARRTLLIAEPDQAALDELLQVFQEEYALVPVSNGQACLNVLIRNENPVSAVLLSPVLPDMSGLDVLRRMQDDTYLASIPVLMLASVTDPTSASAIALGATDFIDRPLDWCLLRLRVKNAIHKREMEELRAQNRFLLLQRSDESRQQNLMSYLADHDPLTGVCNKDAFYRKTRAMIDQAPDVPFVLIAFDVEKFRVINDIFGMEEGDRLLRHIASRMRSLYGGTRSATFSRIDADNFALCVPFDRDALASRSEDNNERLREYDLPFDLVLVYGLYIIDDRSLSVSAMYDRAVMAKRTVKGNYVNRHAYYDDTLRQTLLDELEIVNSMHAALEQNQFEVYLQPKCRLVTGEIVGAEALVRWNHPTRGVLSPAAFVPIFERNGFILKLDLYVWERVCALLRTWMNRNGDRAPIPVSMNVSRVNIYNPALVNTLCNLADRYSVPRRAIELEITESAYAEDRKLLSEVITELRTRGFTVEMDDFGSAYSSLNMLKEISVDVLKLDMRFLFGNDHDGRGGTILSSVVRMARYLSLPIVAEGVETQEQADFLCSIGCTVGQGYLYYRPMPIPEFERLLSENPIRTTAEIAEITETYPEAAIRRVWSIDGDFSLMLDTIPCAASLCELNADNIELLRINKEYLHVTGDTLERIYKHGMSVPNLVSGQDYPHVLRLFRCALRDRGTTETDFHRLCESGAVLPFHIKIHYLAGDEVRSLFFITYQRLEADVLPQPPSTTPESRSSGMCLLLNPPQKDV